MRNEGSEQPRSPEGRVDSDSEFRTPHSALSTEPATSFKWVIVAGVTVWVLGAAMIVWSRYLSN